MLNSYGLNSYEFSDWRVEWIDDWKRGLQLFTSLGLSLQVHICIIGLKELRNNSLVKFMGKRLPVLFFLSLERVVCGMWYLIHPAD